MSVVVCLNYCRERGYSYAGLEYGEECYCGRAGSQYARYGQHWDSGCQHPCSGYANERCGGIGKVAVYKINTTMPTGEASSPSITTPASSQTTRRTTTTSTPGKSTELSSTSSLKFVKTVSSNTTATTPSATVLKRTKVHTTKSPHVFTERMNETNFDAHSSEEMKYLAVIMGSLFFVGILVISFVLVWNFKLRSRMRAIEDSPLHHQSPELATNPTYEQEDKKIHLVYSDLLTSDLTDNHYESLITSGVGDADGPAILCPRKLLRGGHDNDRYSNLPNRIPSYFPQPDLYENYRYSYMQ
ncbi:uncharacterized protein [Diadema antillarum]|uniref:uncharacterized protein n=1 Tax=Diadema antillarum TaxID=105358 RepID=UPI003A89462B